MKFTAAIICGYEQCLFNKTKAVLSTLGPMHSPASAFDKAYSMKCELPSMRLALNPIGMFLVIAVHISHVSIVEHAGLSSRYDYW